jgi:hypothetical protein
VCVARGRFEGFITLLSRRALKEGFIRLVCNLNTKHVERLELEQHRGGMCHKATHLRQEVHRTLVVKSLPRDCETPSEKARW